MKKYNSIFKENLENSKEWKKFEDSLMELYFAELERIPGPNFKNLGKLIASAIVENFRSPTYGEYPIKSAQSDLMEFMEGFNSFPKKI